MMKTQFPYDIRNFDNALSALQRLEEALNIMQPCMHKAITATEQLEPKKAIALIKEAAEATRQAVFSWLWLCDKEKEKKTENVGKILCAQCDKWYDEVEKCCPNCGSDRVYGKETTVLES